MAELPQYGLEDNPILHTDGYKVTHWKQYPPSTQMVYSYLESRGGEFPEVLFFGLQYIMKKTLSGKLVTAERIDDAEEFSRDYFGNDKMFNRAGWEHILREHDGRLPISINAVPEGSVVATHNVLMTVENTDPKAYWLTNYVESVLMHTWYPITVATLSMNIKQNILGYLERTGDPSTIDFKLHDFGFRGASTIESARVGGGAHLVNFKGTDTMDGIVMLRRYYGERMAGASIPAAEHSTITSWGREHEVEAMKNMLEQFPTGLVAVVSDSFNIFEACRDIWGDKLKSRVLERDGVLVIRPDSGEPVDVVMEVLDILEGKFGSYVNSKGFRVLNDKVRLIQGDGVDAKIIDDILRTMEERGWSADNIAFGMGGALLQKSNRDTQKMAIKCSSVVVDGEERGVSKDPITDPGKRSMEGRLKLVFDPTRGHVTVPLGSPGKNELIEVFRDGEVTTMHSLAQIRARAEQQRLFYEELKEGRGRLGRKVSLA